MPRAHGRSCLIEGADIPFLFISSIKSDIVFWQVMALLAMKRWKVTGAKHGFDGLSIEEATVPQVGENQVLVKLHAALLTLATLLFLTTNTLFP